MDCPICLDKKPNRKSLLCSHELCTSCYLRLDTTKCPFCRTDFNYTAEDIKQRAKIGLANGYQSNNTQPGLLLPDEFVFQNHQNTGFYLNNLLNDQMIVPTRRNTIISRALNLEESMRCSSNSKNKRNKYDYDLMPKRLSKEEIDHRRNILAKRENKKWSMKNGRLLKEISCMC